MRTNCTKIACLLSIAWLPLFPAKAQFHLGIKAGAAISNISVSPTPSHKYDSRTMVTFGFFGHINLGKKFLLRPELVITGKGAKTPHTNTYTYNNTQYTYSYINRLTFTYLDIPLNLLYAIPLGQRKLLVGGGPVISLLLNQKQNYGMETKDVGANLLVMYEWPIGFSIGVNYMQGLKDITYKYSSNTSKVHYTGFTIGYWF